MSGLVLALAAGQVQAGEVLHGDEVISLLVGNTVEATYHNAGESGRHGFFEYYTEDGKILGWETKLEQAGNYTHYVGSWKLDGDKLCASVYGRPYSCSSFEKIKDGEYRRISDNMKFGNVTLHQGKYHPVN
ncbi:MAG: hypothetical protein CSB48_01635 [Proteobacteria bacterium]|nr:MAG: hypothetical protein CSB48_01635 [Pseudomonadota bacterium]